MQIQLSTEQLELLVWLGHIFRKGISAEWLEALATQDVKRYPDGVIMTNVDKGVLFINSGTRANAKFSHAMQKEVVHLIKSNDHVVLQSSYPIPTQIANKLKLSYNSEAKYYTKGGL